jgi:hypothetical protein
MPSRARCSVKRSEVYWAGVGVVDQLPGPDGLSLPVAVPQRYP